MIRASVGCSWAVCRHSEQSYHGAAITAEAYRLKHPVTFDGVPQTYAQKTADSDAARADPLGLYHGMSVRHDGGLFALCGPPVNFVPGQSEQLALF